MKKIFTLIVLCFSVLITQGQVKTIVSPEQSILENVKLINDNKKATHVKKFMPFDVQKRLDEDAANEGLDIPFRFGEGFDTNITLSEENWTKAENGRLWSMEFESAGAYSINFVFNDFYLPEGAELYIANREETMLYGPVTSKQNTKNGFFLTDLVQGDNVTLYLFEPADKHGQARLTIKRVVHAYKNLFSELYGGFGTALGCHNNIDNFPAWDLESDAVALVLLSSGNELCSGSLVMTADQSFRPFFLTAFHCIDASENGELSVAEKFNAQNWMFKFQYKQSTYTGNSRTSGISYNGAEFRAAWNNSDFALMEMDDSPAGDNRFSWLGWDRSGNTPTSGTGIHHPAGDIMKISFDNHGLVSNQTIINWIDRWYNIISTSPINSHWSVGFDSGTTEGGSSGSPLFDQHRRVIGQLHGGPTGCAPITKYYGRFDLSWTGGGTNDTRLSNWLDPTGSGAMTTNTARFPTITISGPSTPLLCQGPSAAQTFTVSNAPAGFTWACSSNISFVGSTAGSTASAAGSGYPGIGWVGVKNAAGAVMAKFDLWVGGTTMTGIYHDNGDLYYAGLPDFDVESFSTFEWKITDDYGNSCQDCYVSKIYGTNYAYVSLGSPGIYLLECTVTNACTPNAFFGNTASTYIGMYRSPSAYPNPASDILNIEIDTQSQSSAPAVTSGKQLKVDKTFDIRLYDGQGNLLRAQKAGGGTVQFNVAGLPDGIYYLHIYDGSGNRPEMRQVVVEH